MHLHASIRIKAHLHAHYPLLFFLIFLIFLPLSLLFIFRILIITIFRLWHSCNPLEVAVVSGMVSSFFWGSSRFHRDTFPHWLWFILPCFSVCFPRFFLSPLSLFSPFFFGCCSRFFAILGLCRDYLAPLRILLQSFLYPPTPLPPSSPQLSLSLSVYFSALVSVQGSSWTFKDSLRSLTRFSVAARHRWWQPWDHAGISEDSISVPPHPRRSSTALWRFSELAGAFDGDPSAVSRTPSSQVFDILRRCRSVAFSGRLRWRGRLRLTGTEMRRWKSQSEAEMWIFEWRGWWNV